MGPETKIRAPGAFESIKKKLIWKFSAAALLTASAVFPSDKSTPDASALSNGLLSAEPPVNLKTADFGLDFENRHSGLTFSRDFQIENNSSEISEPEESTDRSNCDEIRDSDYRSITERDFFLENCKLKIHMLRVDGGDYATITGYYCLQVPGYYIGDGGGFCGNMASGIKPFAGAAACGPNWAIGTLLLIENYGQITCLDRGGAVVNNYIDVWFLTNKEMMESNLPRLARVEIVDQNQ